MKVLVTGAAGFIGMHVAAALAARGDAVVGLDNLNDYYDVALKRGRLAELAEYPGFRFVAADVAERAALDALFEQARFDRVVHLAAQAGVRYSLTNPHAYAQSNLVGFLNILEACRGNGIEHLVYASSSSVYGGNRKLPFDEDDGVDHPVSLYAATKKSNELMAHAYSHLYRLPTTGLRFFTVYGPWGRPDMAYFKFTEAILQGREIEVYNRGRMQRAFTYIDDVVEGVLSVLDSPAEPDPAFDAQDPRPSVSDAPYRVLNIGNHDPMPLLDFIAAIERAVGQPARRKFMPMQPGDVLATHADVSRLTALAGFSPATPLAEGAQRFVDWYREHYRRAG